MSVSDVSVEVSPAIAALDRIVYEKTHNTYEIIPSSQKEEITLTDIFGDGSAVVLHNFVSPEEIEQLRVQSSSIGFESSRYPSSYRVCDRISANGGLFKDVLFQRLEPFLSDMMITGSIREKGVHESMLEGQWHPYALNPCFRVVKYSPGGFFHPHFDGGFEVSRTIASLKTLMVYLNDGFEGGTTSFYDTDSGVQLYKEPNPAAAIFVYHPRAGDCLIFNHFLLHDGGRLITGEKWICRSEVMYEKL